MDDSSRSDGNSHRGYRSCMRLKRRGESQVWRSLSFSAVEAEVPDGCIQIQFGLIMQIYREVRERREEEVTGGANSTPECRKKGCGDDDEQDVMFEGME